MSVVREPFGVPILSWRNISQASSRSLQTFYQWWRNAWIVWQSVWQLLLTKLLFLMLHVWNHLTLVWIAWLFSKRWENQSLHIVRVRIVWTLSRVYVSISQVSAIMMMSIDLHLCGPSLTWHHLCELCALMSQSGFEVTFCWNHFSLTATDILDRICLKRPWAYCYLLIFRVAALIVSIMRVSTIAVWLILVNLANGLGC